MLEQNGLEPQQVWLIDRPTPVEGEDGMVDWLAMFARFAPKDQLHNVADRLRARPGP